MTGLRIAGRRALSRCKRIEGSSARVGELADGGYDVAAGTVAGRDRPVRQHMATELVNRADRPHETVHVIPLHEDLLHLIGKGSEKTR